MKFPYLAGAAAVVYVLTILGLSLRIELLEVQNGELESQLHDVLVKSPTACPAVLVTCECPNYDAGWDDAEYLEGCGPDMNELSLEDLMIMCAGFDVDDHIAGC